MERLRSRRLTSVFIVLSTLTLAVVAGSFAAHGVRGSEDKQVSSSDATPLKITNSTIPPNEFVRIAKAAGPAVVNINTQTLPKQGSVKHKQNPHSGMKAPPQNPGDDEEDDQQGQQDGQGNFQDFFNRFFGGQNPNGGMGQMPDEGVRESL